MDGCSDNAAEKLACSIKRSEVPLIIAVVASLCHWSFAVYHFFFFFPLRCVKKIYLKDLAETH